MKNKGFTLIELLLYISLAGIISFVLIIFLSDILQSRVKNRTIALVEQQGVEVLQRIVEAGRNAEFINSPATSTSAVTLSLKMTSTTINPTVFDLANGAIRTQEGVGTSEVLTNNLVNASGLMFYNLGRAGTYGNFMVYFTLAASSTSNNYEYNYSKTFFTSVSLR